MIYMKCKYYEKRDISVGNDAFDHPDYQIFCKKKGRIHGYECGTCELKEFETLALIPVGRCDQCPKHFTERTPRSGFAEDYFCKAVQTPAGPKKITSYVEWDSEIPPVPDWCPYHIKEVK